MRRILFIITFLAASVLSFANDNIFSPPAVPTLVADNANVFTNNERLELENKLNSFSNKTSTQILVYTTTDLQGYDIADFAQRLGEGWGIGQDDFDNGVVIVYKPKTDSTSGEVTIQTGYGIEPLIPDITCKQIIEQEMIPSFRQGLVYEGIDNAVDICISLIKGEYSANGNADTTGEGSPILGLAILIAIILMGYPIFGAITKKTEGKKATFGQYLIWVLAFILNILLSSGRGGSTYHGSSRGSSHGFGGYGGGHFGGGGASGRW
ncbi:MAG: TPM domain-containing protein [Salinivirgaceae bacterium]|nr:TPM domain-containing protein [Salinivirgaceae bacterium]